MNVWPASLPQYVLENGYQEQLPPNTVETEMETGTVKIRRRYTKVFRKFGVSIQMTEAEAAIFEEFYLLTCASGTLPFSWAHPRTRAPMDFRFRRPPPVYQSIGGTYVRASFMIEET